MKIDTEMVVFLPKNSKGLVTSIFQWEKINEICGQKQRLWIVIINKSFKETVEIKKDQPLGFLVIQPEHLKFKYDTEERREQTKRIFQRTNQKWKKQPGGFLNHYDFACAGRDTVNQAVKVAPSVIKAATNDMNEIATNRINQTIAQGGKKVECVLSKILRGAIEDICQMPFRLLSKFGKQHFIKIRKKVLS